MNHSEHRHRGLLVTSLVMLLFSVLAVFVAARQPYLSRCTGTWHTSKATRMCERGRAITRELRRNDSPRGSTSSRAAKTPHPIQRSSPAILSAFLQFHPLRSPPMA